MNEDPEPAPVPVKEEVVKKTALDNYKEMTNYNFVLSISEDKNNNSEPHIYNGKTYNGISIIDDKYFLKDNVIYEIKDNKIKILEATLFDINIFKLKPVNISDLTQLGELNFETKYSDGSVEKSYLVPLKEVVKSFKGEQLNDPKKTVEIKYKEKDNYVVEVELDLTNYQQYINNTSYTYIIKITYNNINHIEPFKTDYSVVS